MELIKKDRLAISIITLTEILTGISQSEQEQVEKSFADVEIIGFADPKIAQLAANYRTKSGLRTPDAIIAASCEFGAHQFYTYDKDFLRLKKRWIHVVNY